MAEMLTAPLVEWDSAKQYGFLDLGRRRLFLHIKDFAAVRRQPEIGDVIQFSVGTDSQGRSCAVHAVHFGFPSRQPDYANRPTHYRRVQPSKTNGLHLHDFAFLILLLIAPVWALYRLELLTAVTIISAVALSAITFLTYVLDKMRAQSRDWRISENTLRFLALIGGWPGAFLAQQHVRHKTSKTSFLILFWLTVFLWQYLAIDYLLDWKIFQFVRNLKI